jgi:hypothetical protein
VGVVVAGAKHVIPSIGAESITVFCDEGVVSEELEAVAESVPSSVCQ